ncbi:MAG: hypothetical protein WCK02_07670 [Bacteroidota bacterium]
MKKIVFIALVCSFLGISCTSSKDKATKYYDKITKLENNLIVAIDSLDASMKVRFPKKMFEAQQFALNLAKSYNDTINTLAEFDNDSALLHATRVFFSELSGVIDNEYGQLIAINALPEEMYSQVMEDRSVFLNQEIDRKLSESLKKLTDSMKVFAKKYEFEIKVE